MVKLTLFVKMEVENATEVKPKQNFQFVMNILCTSCRQEHGTDVYMSPDEECELSGSRGSANFVFRCQDCKKEHSASFVPPTSSSKDLIVPYTSQTAEWQPLICLDCRGLEPTSFLVNNGQGGSWQCVSFSEEEGAKTKREQFVFEIDEDGRWDDYDEANSREIGVREIESKWQRT
ncbi:hypothetical protein NliqN6_4702 [Naganishia liquefaciens]|uniref:DUF866-domain-containing protein n=1 Tax=Naganishia liquefaciens TaxID=104408 RepID=A0A8H3YG11_9TREE|nr:hypothetical protein NliqN6_4702 [Naganishia liquefaciens]